jgi:hypothetical protein
MNAELASLSEAGVLMPAPVRCRAAVAAFVIALFALVVAGVAARAGVAVMADGPAPDSLIWPFR